MILERRFGAFQRYHLEMNLIKPTFLSGIMTSTTTSRTWSPYTHFVGIQDPFFVLLCVLTASICSLGVLTRPFESGRFLRLRPNSMALPPTAMLEPFSKVSVINITLLDNSGVCIAGKCLFASLKLSGFLNSKARVVVRKQLRRRTSQIVDSRSRYVLFCFQVTQTRFGRLSFTHVLLS